MKQIIVIAYLLFIIAVAVFPFSSAGVSGLNKIHLISFRLDHLLHMVAFIPLYPLGVWVLGPSGFRSKAYLLLAGLAFAAVAEYLQFFIAYRAYNPADLIANMAGVLIGFLAYVLWERFFQQ